MPEEALETQDMSEKLDQTKEGLEEEHKLTGWILWLSLSTALIAVLAAIASLQSGAYANDAIVQKNDAVLQQSKADDEWAYYQAKGIKAILYSTQSEIAPRPELATKWKEDGDREKREQAERMDAAREHEKEAGEQNEASEHSLHRHHQFAKAVTVFQVAIALAAIGALTRRKLLWWTSLGVGAVGAVFFVMGFL